MKSQETITQSKTSNADVNYKMVEQNKKQFCKNTIFKSLFLYLNEKYIHIPYTPKKKMLTVRRRRRHHLIVLYTWGNIIK